MRDVERRLEAVEGAIPSPGPGRFEVRNFEDLKKWWASDRSMDIDMDGATEQELWDLRAELERMRDESG